MTNDQDSIRADSFQVVLIDIQKAANKEIHCVKKPLTDQLEYVAISYRWGELQETSVNTQVGYVASITSFDIQDFYKLCAAITKEPTMSSIPYVWVDAICVNQSNYDERKETIYHMTDIYERASCILAVPDLHEEHLKAMHQQVMASIQQHQRYLYYLLQGNTKKLYKIDQSFLNTINVPQDSNLRRLLTKYTDSFADSFMTPVKLNRYYDHVRTIEHLYDLDKKKKGTASSLQTIIYKEHQCDEVNCPLQYFNNLSHALPYQQQSEEWGRCIIERRTTIHQAMHFLTNLIVDWSSRVWVISEFHISKKKNNLKFWFNQLQVPYGFPFYTFDMNDPRFTKIKNTIIRDVNFMTSDPVFLVFYQQLVNRLNRQTFLEMMLKSKASKNEDRFYAIFPFFPEYKHLIQKEELVTNVNSILSVKLKLYQAMTNEHKVLLFYLATKGTPTYVLPTFATSVIHWPDSDQYNYTASVPNARPLDITLLYQETLGHYLRVKPTKYAVLREICCSDAAASRTLNQLLHPKTLRQANDGLASLVDVLWISDTIDIKLIGSFDENTWIVGRADIEYFLETMDDLADDFPCFHVY